MKIGSVTNVGNDIDLLDGCLAGLSQLDRRVVVASDKTYQGRKMERGDILPILDKHNADLITLDEYDQAVQRNAGIHELADMDWVLVVDVDEYYKRDMIFTLLQQLDSLKGDAYGVMMKNFFRYADYEINEQEGVGRTPFLIRKSVGFVAGRRVATDVLPYDSFRPYHFCYVRTPEQMKYKLMNFSHAPEVVSGFYEQKWLPFDGSQTNLHPTNPQIWTGAKKVQLPIDIIERLPQWSLSSSRLQARTMN